MQTISQTFEYPVIYSGRRTKMQSFNKERIVEICFNIIEQLADSLIGAIIGAIIGWSSGWYLASVYRIYCEPTHFISFDVVNKWYYLTYIYARYGMVIGAAIGVLIMSVITLKKMTRKIEQETVHDTKEMETYFSSH